MTKIRSKSEYEKKGAEVSSYPSQYANNDYGTKRKAKTHTLVMKNSLTGQVFGYKTVEENMKFSDFLNERIECEWDVEFDDGSHETVSGATRADAKVMLKNKDKHIKKIVRTKLAVNEAKEDTRLPQSVVSGIASLIKKGAKDLAQAWKNVFELVHTAYHVANIKRPTPEQKGAWTQYEEMLKVGVRALADARGLSNKWRLTNPAYVENATPDLDAILVEAAGKDRKHRIFVRTRDIGFDDGEKEFEVEAASMDEVIQSFMSQAKRNGRHVRIEPKSNSEVHLTVYVKGVNKTRDEKIIKMKDWSV